MEETIARETWKPDEKFEVARILNVDIFDTGIHYFVKWKGYSEDDNSWVHENEFYGDFALLKAFKARHVKKIESLRKEHGFEKVCGVKMDKLGDLLFGIQYKGFQQKSWLPEYRLLADAKAAVKNFKQEHPEKIKELQKSYKASLLGRPRKRKSKDETMRKKENKKRRRMDRGEVSSSSETTRKNNSIYRQALNNILTEVEPTTSTENDEAVQPRVENNDTLAEETNPMVQTPLHVPDTDQDIFDQEMETNSSISDAAQSNGDRSNIQATQQCRLQPVNDELGWNDDDSILDPRDDEQRKQSLKWNLRPPQPRRRLWSEERHSALSKKAKASLISNEVPNLSSIFYLTTDNKQRNLIHLFVSGKIDFDNKDEEMRFIANITNKQALFQQDCDGNTPLHSAVIAGENRFIIPLLDLGSPVDKIRNNEGYTPIECAYVYDKETCLNTLLSNGANFKTLSGLPMQEGSEVDNILLAFKENQVKFIENLHKNKMKNFGISLIEGELREIVTFSINDGNRMGFKFSCSEEEEKNKQFLVNIEHFGLGEGEIITPQVYVNKYKAKQLRCGLFRCRGIKKNNSVIIRINEIQETRQFLAVQVFMK